MMDSGDGRLAWASAGEAVHDKHADAVLGQETAIMIDSGARCSRFRMMIRKFLPFGS